MGFSPSRTSVNNERVHQFRLLGTGAADPTIELAPSGATVTRQATGVFRITMPSGSGTFVGVRGYMLGAATPGDVKGQTVTRDTYTAPTATALGFLDIALWSSTFAADDLQTTEYLDIAIVMTQ